jgi:hypothetical protein
MTRDAIDAFLGALRWIDGRPLAGVVEPYRRDLLARFAERDANGAARYSLGLFGRAKKNWKTADAMLYALFVAAGDWTGGAQVYVLANDEGQAGDDLALLKKLIKANPVLHDHFVVKRNVIERKDGDGFIEILPAKDIAGAHGKTYRLAVFDEIHSYRTYDLFEALAPDPHRLDAQVWVTSYASLFHRPGVPLFDLLAAGKRGDDPRMLFSWFAADYCTDPAYAALSPEQRANPSMASWKNDGYLAQQRRRLPAHKFRRLHLNLPGVPDGAAFQPDPVMDAVARGVTVRAPLAGVAYHAFVDMSGGSSDDAVLAIGHVERDGRRVLDCVQDQGPRPPFDPNLAVTRFVTALRMYGIARVMGDAYAGETFKSQFETARISYVVCGQTKHQLYESLEPDLNGHRVVVLDVPQIESQLLGLVWRGGRIDHQPGEHDDFANAVAGVCAAMAGATWSAEDTRALWAHDNGDVRRGDRLTLASMAAALGDSDAAIPDHF